MLGYVIVPWRVKIQSYQGNEGVSNHRNETQAVLLMVLPIILLEGDLDP